MNISDEAVEAAAIASYARAGGGTPESWQREEDYYRREYLEDARVQLEAAAPILLSHEREETRLAHLDAMVNRETKQAELAAAWDQGESAGRGNYGRVVRRKTNPYRSQA